MSMWYDILLRCATFRYENEVCLAIWAPTRRKKFRDEIFVPDKTRICAQNSGVGLLSGATPLPRTTVVPPTCDLPIEFGKIRWFERFVSSFSYEFSKVCAGIGGE